MSSGRLEARARPNRRGRISRLENRIYLRCRAPRGRAITQAVRRAVLFDISVCPRSACHHERLESRVILAVRSPGHRDRCCVVDSAGR